MPDPIDTAADTAALTALMAGATGEALPEPAASPEPAPTPEPVAADPPAPEAVDPPPLTDTPAADDPLAALGLKPKAEEPAPDAPKPDAVKPEGEPEPEPAAPTVDEEIAALGMKGKTAERFRELTGKLAEAEPVRAELERVGVKSVEDVQQLIADANTGLQMVDLVRNTGADEAEYTMALDWLALRSRGRSGDRAAAEEAFAVIEAEYKTLCTVLGKEVPGVYDPVEGHEDLQAALEAGDITREYATQLASQRNLQALAQQGQAQAQQAQQAQQQASQAHEAAKADLTAVGNALQAEDAGRFTHYYQTGAITALIGEVRAAFPDRPDLWATQVELRYRRLPAVASAYAPTPTPKPAPTPTPVAHAAPLAHVLPDPSSMDPEAAMLAGIAAATR